VNRKNALNTPVTRWDGLGPRGTKHPGSRSIMATREEHS
jgi:hypothetical protein